VHVERHAAAEAFLDHAGAFLLDREAENNLILGLAARLRQQPRVYGQDPYFAVAEERGRVVAAALRTPPHNLLLSEPADESALEPLAADALSAFNTLPGVLGPSGSVAQFAGIWENKTRAAARLAIRERIYRAETVITPEGARGRMRLYADTDWRLAVEWLEAFVAEALPGPPPEDAGEWLERRLSEPEGGIVFWEDGKPVCIAGFGGATPNGVRVGPVFTPPELRGRGFASALVAELTRARLKTGKRFCFLFTDLANAASNTIYQRVGYRPVADVDQWSFVTNQA
jgi:uncharacterized protein